jgi:hypothetical protein
MERITMKYSPRNLLVIAIFIAFATGIPTTGKSASGKTSEKECIEKVRKLMKKRGISRSKEASRITQRYCAKGDYKGAINAIEKAKPTGKPPRKTSEKECLRKLEKYIKTKGFKPDREAYRTAQRYCAKGDYRGAINAIKKAK